MEENEAEGEKGHQSIQGMDDTLENEEMDLASVMERLQSRFPNLSADTVANLAMREMDKWEKKKEDRSELGELKREIQKLKSKKRKVSETDQEEEIEGEPILLEETYQLLDNAVDKVDLKLRHRLLTPNGDPKTWWTRENGAMECRITKPMRGASLHLEHLMLGRVSNLTLMRMEDSGKVSTAAHS